MSNKEGQLTYDQLQKKCEYLEESLSVIYAENAKDRDLQRNPTDFESAAIPLMLYMRNNHHPHVRAIVDSVCAELLEGIKSINTKQDNQHKMKEVVR